MSELIFVRDRCGGCGVELGESDNFCSHCGHPAVASALPARQADAISRPQQIAIPARQIVVVPATQLSVVDQALNNRAIVVGILLVAGPIGLPALWFSGRFSKRAKIVATAVYFLLTAILPLVALWYFLEVSLRPLLDVFAG